MKRNLSLKVSDIIREKILNFSLPPGFRISDVQLAQEMKISRTPVREALNRLTAEGIVEALPNRGFVVKVFGLKEIEDTYILRERLETFAVELTTKKFNRTKQKEFETLLDKSDRFIKKNDIAGFNTSDEDFHQLIALSSENQPLGEVLKNLMGRIRVVRRYDHLRPGSIKDAYKSHREILDLMIKKDVERAVKKMSDHVIISMNLVLEFISGNEHLFGPYEMPNLQEKYEL
ncbi:MAG: GntR family transcriptional regulator [Pseudomonadota bacterium]